MESPQERIRNAMLGAWVLLSERGPPQLEASYMGRLVRVGKPMQVSMFGSMDREHIYLTHPAYSLKRMEMVPGDSSLVVPDLFVIPTACMDVPRLRYADAHFPLDKLAFCAIGREEIDRTLQQDPFYASLARHFGETLRSL